MEQKRADARETVANLDAAAAKTKKVKSDEFKTKLRQAIEATMKQPKTETEAKDVMEHGAKNASETLHGNLASERDAAVGPLKSTTEVTAAPVQASTATLHSEPIGPPPAPVSAAPVVPAPLPPERLDYSADRGPTDQVMAENNVSKEQLQEGNDPAFGPTIAARTTAEKHEATAEAKYRQGESKVQDQAHTAATLALTKDLAGMQGVREQQIGKVVSQQHGTKSKDAQERQRITDTINGIKNKTRTDVEGILTSMETDAGTIFEAGLKRAEKAYEETFAEAKGGIGSRIWHIGRWDEHIAKSLGEARKVYFDHVDTAINDVSTFIDGKLEAAKQRVADGRKEVDNFVNGLDASVKQFGEDALQAVSADFDTMGSDIDQRRDGLINKLTEQYKASFERMSAMEDKLREENKSLWQRVYDATVGLIKKIIEFKNMLLGALGKAAAVIGDIIAHPIRFLGNLVSGVMQGLKNFMSKLPTYLMKGLMDWLFGAVAGTGLQLPDKFDLQGIISIVLQILGLTYANFRARAVTIVGEPIVAAIEKTAEVFKVIVTEGVPGLWRFIKEQLANLKSMVLDAIFDYIKEKVIMAGITWIIGLLNPASAFFKACKAIYDIVMFFITRGQQIMELVNAVLDSIAAIAKGSIGVAAGLVENALAKAIPVAIGFLASLLGLGDPSKPVREFIEKARAPVNKAIDWVINLAVKGVEKLVGLLVGKKDKPDERSQEQKKVDLAKGIGEAQKLLEEQNLTAEQIRKKLPGIRSKYKITIFELVTDSKSQTNETDHIHGEIHSDPVKADSKKVNIEESGSVELAIISTKQPRVSSIPASSISRHRGETTPSHFELTTTKAIAKATGLPVEPSARFETREKRGGIVTRKAPAGFREGPEGLLLPTEPRLFGSLSGDPRQRDLEESRFEYRGGDLRRIGMPRHPDALLITPQQIEPLEFTLDASLSLLGREQTRGATPHKIVQIPATIEVILRNFPRETPIVYTVVVKSTVPPARIEELRRALRTLGGNINVTVIFIRR